MSMPHVSPRLLSRDTLLALGRSAEFAKREARFRGDSQTVSIASMSEDDRDIIRALYTFLVRLKAAVEPRNGAVDIGVDVLKQFLVAQDYDALPERVTRLGSRLRAEGLSDKVRAAYHDLRGGSLQALLMHLDLVNEDEALPNDVQRVYFLVRDHLKMMRNAVHDLDRDAYDRDLMPKGHAVSLLEEKWAAVSYPGTDRPVQVRLHNEVEGDVSECCMEFSALDRVLYNLVNNAARFASDGVVDVVLLPVAGGTQLRFLIVNRVAQAHREHLLKTFGGENVSALLRGGFTTGGHGVGTRICSEFVAHGYGLSSVSQVISGDYVGAKLIDDCFVTWFHWPALLGSTS